MIFTSSMFLLLAGLPAPSHLPPRAATLSPLSQATAAQTPGPGLKRKRVLQLRGGQSVRGLTQLVDGDWRLRRNGDWITIPGTLVELWRDEGELLRESRRLGRDLSPKDTGQRTVYAQWLVKQGLIEEASGEINAILNIEPDAPAILSLLKSKRFARPRAGNPEADPQRVARTLIGAGQTASALQRELLIQSLGELQQTQAGAEVLRSELRAGLNSISVLKRGFSAHALRRLLPGQELFLLMQRCVLDVSSSVRLEAALAVRAAGDPGLVIPLIKALGSDSRAVRTNAAESLGNLGYATAIPALVTHFANLPQSGGGGVAPTTAHITIGTQFMYVQDFDVEIAQAASIADPIVGSIQDAVVLDARVGGISGITFRKEYRTLNSALKSLTGANPGSSPADWQRWFDENQAQYRKH